MAMCGASCEIWVGVYMESRESMGGTLEVSRYSYRETMFFSLYGEELSWFLYKIRDEEYLVPRNGRKTWQALSCVRN